MNRRINRQIAGVAADRMAAAKFNTKLASLRKELSDHVELLIENYIPYAVRALVDAYPSYFETTRYVSLSAIDPNNKYGIKLKWISTEQSISLPKSCKFITISFEDYQQLKVFSDALKLVEAHKETFYEECFKALIAIKTEKNLKEQFPAAIPYVEFPEVVQLPAAMYNSLNEAVKCINNDQDE